MTQYLDLPAQTVSAIAVIDLANELLDAACISNDELSKLGDEFNALYSEWKNNKPIQEARLPENLLVMLWEQASESKNDPNLGLNIGSKVNNKTKGVLANWLCQCNTLSEAFDTFRDNIHLLNPSESWEKTELKDRVKISVHFKSNRYPLLAVDRSMAASISWSSALIGSQIKPIRVSFTHTKSNRIHRYEEIFGQNIEFGSEENAIEFSKEAFNQPVKAANPYLKSLLETKARELSSSLSANPSISEKVTSLLTKDLPLYCQIESVCQVLNLSRSTLYRKLKNEGLNYTSLVKQVRINKIKSLEGKTVNHYDIAEALGFSDIGSYYRFRKNLR